ncbi:unnamed protein product [Acanthosepion pharaonis]|uniref:Uncharacterized protein n=1 Tax=Acanthosepion pharaonis TaxID=158019 RepID=A0A812C985_ACAPH|nr:unnamed protein product [Sepia pharaonis]
MSVRKSFLSSPDTVIQDNSMLSDLPPWYMVLGPGTITALRTRRAPPLTFADHTKQPEPELEPEPAAAAQLQLAAAAQLQLAAAAQLQSAAAAGRPTSTSSKLPSCDSARQSYQGRTDYTSAVRVDPLSPQAPTRSLHKYRHPGINWTSNTAVPSPYLQAVTLKPDDAPSKLHDRTTTNDYLLMRTVCLSITFDEVIDAMMIFFGPPKQTFEEFLLGFAIRKKKNISEERFSIRECIFYSAITYFSIENFENVLTTPIPPLTATRQFDWCDCKKKAVKYDYLHTKNAHKDMPWFVDEWPYLPTMKFIEKQQSFKKILQRATGKISLFFS